MQTIGFTGCNDLCDVTPPTAVQLVDKGRASVIHSLFKGIRIYFWNESEDKVFLMQSNEGHLGEIGGSFCRC
jgi:hypothetical protein